METEIGAFIIVTLSVYLYLYYRFSEYEKTCREAKKQLKLLKQK